MGVRGNVYKIAEDFTSGLRKGACPTPGARIRSGGRGRGLARGRGIGPVGNPFKQTRPGSGNFDNIRF